MICKNMESNMIRKINKDAKGLIGILLIGDEQLDMIEKYLYRGDVFEIYNDKKIIAACVVTKEGDRIYELKNISVDIEFQKCGIGQKMISFFEKYYSDKADILLVGTGESPITLGFYRKCGFKESHRIKDFFVNNYDHPIYECGNQLIDMIYFKKEL